MSFLGLGKTEKKEIKTQAALKAGSVFVSGSGFIKRPLVSEKALSMESKGEYVFEVYKNATKPEIKKEVERKYGVKVSRVNVSISKPKIRIFRGKSSQKSGFKKVMVKLKPGQKLELNSK